MHTKQSSLVFLPHIHQTFFSGTTFEPPSDHFDSTSQGDLQVPGHAEAGHEVSCPCF